MAVLPMESAKLLVNFDSSDKLHVYEDGLNVLRSIPDEFGIIPLAAVGPGRIGKSSLLNQLIGKDSFGVGSTTSRVTKGIWIDKKLDKEKKIATIYIDVEGFGDPKRSNTASSDNSLLLVVCQICDVVMYNTKTALDDELTGKLLLVCQLFKRYRRQTKLLSQPILVTILRDFDLDIPDSPDHKLRELLKKHGGETAVESFRSIEVYTFVKPTERLKLRKLKHMSEEELEPEYVSVREKLKDFFLDEAKPLCTRGNRHITGTVLVEVLNETVTAVNGDNMDRMTKTIEEILQQQNEKLKIEALKKYKSRVLEEWPILSAPEPIHKRCQESTMNELKQMLYDIYGINNIILLQQFKNQTDEQFDNISKEKSSKVLAKLKETIDQKYRNGSYFCIGGSYTFRFDKKLLESAYKALKHLGPRANDIWQPYQSTLIVTEEMIKSREDVLIKERNAARELAAARREQEIARQRREEVERRRVNLEAEQREREQERERRERERERERDAELLNFGFEMAKIAIGLAFRLW